MYYISDLNLQKSQNSIIIAKLVIDEATPQPKTPNSIFITSK